jgi:DNA-binding FadR family transcriptional regulator
MHQTFSVLCHNRVSAAVLRAIETTLSRVFTQLPAGYADIILRDWHDIIRATAEHRADDAEALMKSHITFFNEILLEQAAPTTP